MHLPPASPVCSIAHEKINFSEQYIQAPQRIALHGTEFQFNSNICCETSCDQVPKPYVNQLVGLTGKREQSSHCVGVQIMRKGRLPSWREGGRRRGRSWWVRMVWECTEVGLRLRMEEQRAETSPAPMIPLTIGSNFLFSFFLWWFLRIFFFFWIKIFKPGSLAVWFVEENNDKIKLVMLSCLLQRTNWYDKL